MRASLADEWGGAHRLKYTRAILDAIHSGELAQAEYETYEIFNLHVPKSARGVPSELLNPKRSWTAGEADFKEQVTKLGNLFVENFKKYADEATPDVIAAGRLFFSSLFFFVFLLGRLSTVQMVHPGAYVWVLGPAV